MKKNSFIAIVLAVVLGFILSACGKDDVVHIGPTNIVYSIVGGWYKWQFPKKNKETSANSFNLS